MAKDRVVIPGIPTDAARVIIDRMSEQDERIALLERKAGRPGIVTTDVAAKVGEFLNIEGPADLITVILPEATQALRNARITLAFRNENPVRIVSVNGTVNRVPFVLNNLPGTYDAIADGLGGWSVQVGVTEEGVIGTPSVPGALADIPDHRVLGNDSGVDGPPVPITVHQELDWLTTGALWLFDGVDDRVEFADVNDIERTDSVTISAWLRTSDGVSQQAIAGKLEASSGFRGWELGTGAGRIYFLLCSAFGSGNAVNVQTAVGLFPAGALTHVAVVYSGTSIPSGFQFYINGAPVATDFIAAAGPITATTLSTQALEIGVRANTNTLPFAGEIHHVSKFNAALTAAQMLEVYNAGTPPNLTTLPTAPDPVWWIKLDELDAIGASGILDYGTGSNEGTAAGGLNPGTLVGSLITRSTSLWQTIPPGTDGLPFVSQGPGAIPAYEQLAMTATGALTGDVTKAAGSSVTAIASGVIVDADVNASAAIAQTKTGALTGFAAKASGSAATTSAEPIVTYSASANMSAERVLSSSTSNTADTSVASQIQVRSAAKTGDVTCPANDNVQTIANDAVTNAKAANMAANSVKANPTTGSADPQDLAIGTDEIVARAAGNVAGIAVASDTGVANIREGNVSTGLGAQPRDEMHRWLASTPNVSVFEEEFQGNLAAMSARFTATAGYVLSASATANAEIWGLLGITQAVGNVAAALTLGASESANCFRHEKVRYICLVVRNSTGITADTAFAVGLVGPFDIYGTGLQGRIAGTSEGRFFSYNTALSANWHCGYRSGSSTAVTNSGVAAANLTRYVFEWFQSDAGAVQMYVNGDLVRNDGAGNGPAAGECTFYLSSLGSTAAARTWQFDYIKVVSQSANRFGG